MKLRIARNRAGISRDANGLGFVALNLADVWLTRIALSLEAGEVNPVMAFLCGNMMAKVLASIPVVFVLWALGKDRLLTPLNIGMALLMRVNPYDQVSLRYLFLLPGCDILHFDGSSYLVFRPYYWIDLL
jgi:hypothetical protein